MHRLFPNLSGLYVVRVCEGKAPCVRSFCSTHSGQEGMFYTLKTESVRAKERNGDRLAPLLGAVDSMLTTPLTSKDLRLKGYNPCRPTLGPSPLVADDSRRS